MKLHYLLILLFGTFISSSFVHPEKQLMHPNEGEVLCLEYNNFDLGERFINDKDTIYFPFENCSQDTVQIKYIKCNNKGSIPYHILEKVPELTKPIPPGGKDTITFYRYIYDQVEPGLYDNSWTITFENTILEQYFNIFTEFKPNQGKIVVERALVDTVKRGDEVTFTAKIKNEGIDPVILTKKWNRNDNVDIITKLPLTLNPGQGAELLFKLRTQNINKHYSSTIQIASNLDGRASYIAIPYTGSLISDKEPEMTFDSLILTAIREKGEKLVYEFWFENTGNAPLIISNAKTSCGCLVATWPREPIKPGERNVIKIKYDTNRIGPINKSCTVNMNAPGSRIILRVKGRVNNSVPIPNRK